MPYSFAYPLWLERRIDALLPAPTVTRASRVRTETPRAQLATPAPPAPPVRPAPPPVAAVVARTRRPGEKATPTREAPVPHALHGRPITSSEAECCADGWQSLCGVQLPGQAGEHGDETGFAAALDAGAAAQEDQESALVAALLAETHGRGMFEVLLPGGITLGVAVDMRPGAVDYLLTPASQRMAAQLRGRQMELAGMLEQRIGRSVRVTVL